MYNTKKYPNPPQNWHDFFDTTKFPGKRALRNAAEGGGYEAALLADGVPREKLYPLDYDRATKKLNTIRKNLVFWDTGAQSQQKWSISARPARWSSSSQGQRPRGPRRRVPERELTPPARNVVVCGTSVVNWIPQARRPGPRRRHGIWSSAPAAPHENQSTDEH